MVKAKALVAFTITVTNLSKILMPKPYVLKEVLKVLIFINNRPIWTGKSVLCTL